MNSQERWDLEADEQDYIELAVDRKRYRCPDTPRFPGDLVGCGSVDTTPPDDEGLCDCLECGIWFRHDEASTPETETTGEQHER